MGRAEEEPSEINLCVKYFLFFTNLTTWVFSLILVGAGLWAWFERGAFDSSDSVTSLIQSPIIDPSWWLVVIGTIIFFIATTGCLGALRENTTLLTLYKVALGLILLLEIGGAVAIYIGFYFYQDEIESTAADYLNDGIAIKGYRDNADFQELLDTIQTELQCCGASGYNDWQANIYFDCSQAAVSANRNPEACGVPYSCCRQSGPVVNTQCGYNVRKDTYDPVLRKQTIYETGCVAGFSSWLTGIFNLYLLAGIGGAILIVEVIGFILAQTLGNSIERQRSKQKSKTPGDIAPYYSRNLPQTNPAAPQSRSEMRSPNTVSGTTGREYGYETPRDMTGYQGLELSTITSSDYHGLYAQAT